MSEASPSEHNKVAKVFSLIKWREQQLHRPSLKSYQNFLTLLTSGQLLLEVRALMEEIKFRTLEQFEIMKGEVLIKEISVRLSSDGIALKEQVDKFQRELHSKLDINN